MLGSRIRAAGVVSTQWAPSATPAPLPTPQTPPAEESTRPFFFSKQKKPNKHLGLHFQYPLCPELRVTRSLSQPSLGEGRVATRTGRHFIPAPHTHKSPFAHAHYCQFRVPGFPHVHVFRIWEEARGPAEDSRRHRDQWFISSCSLPLCCFLPPSLPSFFLSFREGVPNIKVFLPLSFWGQWADMGANCLFLGVTLQPRVPLVAGKKIRNERKIVTSKWKRGKEKGRGVVTDDVHINMSSYQYLPSLRGKQWLLITGPSFD